MKAIGATEPTTDMYPDTPAGRQALADDLTAAGYVPTQRRKSFDRDKLIAMAEAMRDGTFDWAASARSPIILGPDGEILGGHHRVVAAHLAGIDLSRVTPPQVRQVAVCHRAAEVWPDALPDIV